MRKPDLGQPVPEEAAIGIEEPLEHRGDDDGRDRPGEEKRRPHQPAAGELLVEDEGNPEPDHGSDHDRRSDVHQRLAKGLTEHRVSEDLLPVVDPDPLPELTRCRWSTGEGEDD